MVGDLVLGLRAIRVVFGFVLFAEVRSVVKIIVIVSTLCNDLELIKSFLCQNNEVQHKGRCKSSSTVMLLIISDKNTRPEFCNLLQTYSL
jgi:hypothetical protein